MNKKQVIKINDNQLKQIVTETVKRVLNEENESNNKRSFDDEEFQNMIQDLTDKLINVTDFAKNHGYTIWVNTLSEMFHNIMVCKNSLETAKDRYYKSANFPGSMFHDEEKWKGF